MSDRNEDTRFQKERGDGKKTGGEILKKKGGWVLKVIEVKKE